jgi:hypothetical protein
MVRNKEVIYVIYEYDLSLYTSEITSTFITYIPPPAIQKYLIIHLPHFSDTSGANLPSVSKEKCEVGSMWF